MRYLYRIIQRRRLEADQLCPLLNITPRWHRKPCVEAEYGSGQNWLGRDEPVRTRVSLTQGCR